jgi:Flp pilus assembly protein TadD/uncharacterized protein (AIM24 family)
MPDPIPRGPFDQGLFLAHYNKGREHFEARRLDEAERQLEEAYLLRPRDPRVLNLLGLVYFRADKLDKAEEVYRKLIAESPEAHTLHYNLGLICFKLGRLEDAEAAFLKALDLGQGNPKIHFYLGSIYEKRHRYKDAIFQYRQAGANVMVERLQGRIGSPAPDSTAPPGALAPVSRPEAPASPSPPPASEELPGRGKSVRPLSPALMADQGPEPGLSQTARFRAHDDTLPPFSRPRIPPLAEAPPQPPSAPATPSPAPRESFRGLERGLMEVEFSGKVFIKQGTIYSYAGNLTFWVKDKRAGARPALVIVTGTGRLILTDQERDITFMQVAEEPVFVEPSHLLACEEGLQPRYVRLGEGQDALEVVALEGRGMVALSVASKPLPLSVKPGLPVSVPASSVIMWTGMLAPHVVEDPEVYAVVLPSAAGSGRLLRLEGDGRILVEQAAGP